MLKDRGTVLDWMTTPSPTHKTHRYIYHVPNISLTVPVLIIKYLFIDLVLKELMFLKLLTCLIWRYNFLYNRKSKSTMYSFQN